MTKKYLLKEIVSTFLIAVLCSLSMSFALAQSSSLDAHVHGEAQLMIAIEGRDLEIQLRSPAVNIFGFEQEPNTSAQWEEVHRAESLLNDVEQLFLFEGTSCAIISTDIDIPFAEGHEDAVNDEHAHEEHGHEEDGHDSHESHAEIMADYQFECDGDSLTKIDVLFLEQFRGIESLDALWITERNQSISELSVGRSLIDLK